VRNQALCKGSESCIIGSENKIGWEGKEKKKKESLDKFFPGSWKSG